MAKQRNGGGIIEYVHKDGSGDVTFRIQWRDASGRQHKETLGRSSVGWTRSMAKDERRKRMGLAADGYIRPESVLFAVCADRWWEDRQRFKSNYSLGTIRAYRRELAVLKERFGAWKLSDVTTVAVNNFTTERLADGDAPSTVNRTLTILGMILNFAVEEKLLDPHKRPTPRRASPGEFAPRVLTVVEARLIEAELAKNPDPQVRLAFLTAELLMLRRSELCGLKWADLDFEEKCLRITKSKTKRGIRSLYVPSVLLAELQAYRERTQFRHDEDLIFTNSSGDAWRPDIEQGYYDSFHRACKKIGIEEHVRPFHDLRATGITEALKNGVSAPIVMAMAGHESFATTKRYVDLAGITFEAEGEALAERRMGALRVIEGGKAEGSLVQEATN